MLIQSLYPLPSQVADIHLFEFGSESDLQQAITQINTYKDSGSTGPVVLPNGEQIALDPYTLWFIRELSRVNVYLLLFSGLR